MVPGAWVNSYSPGIWQVYRVLPVIHEMRYSLTARRKKSNRVIVFSRRIVDDNWRPAFKTESCERSAVTPLSSDDRERLDRLLLDDVAFAAAFSRYAAEPCPLIVNLSMCIPDISRLESFCRTTLTKAMASGISMEEVLRLLEVADLTRFVGKYPINATLQMVCRDHEVRDGEFILHDCLVHPF